MYYINKCKNCLFKEKYTKSNYTIISKFGNGLKLNIAKKMDSKEGKKEYREKNGNSITCFRCFKNTTPSKPNITKRIRRHMAELNLIATAYNIKRLHNIKKGDKKQWEDNYQEFVKEV